MKKIFAMTAAALSLAACSTNDVADITNDADDNVVNVASATRSADVEPVAMTAQFHLINVTQKEKHNVNYKSDFTLDDNEYKPTYGKIVWYNGKDANGEIANVFQAFSPLRKSSNSASYTDFNLPNDQSTAEKLEAADWMTATTTTTKPADNAITLNFEHKMAKLHFNVTAKDDIGPFDSYSDIIVDNNIIPYCNSTDNTIEAIVNPGERTTNEQIIRLAGTVAYFRHKINFPENITLESCKQYNFNLSIGHYKATITSVSVTDWSVKNIDLGGYDDAVNPYS